MEKMKVVILGSTGMLGHQVYYQFLKENLFELYDISFRTKLTSNSIVLDVFDREKLLSTIREIKPTFIINCIGVLIKGSNTSASNAIYINSYLPHLLNDISNQINSKLVHISTDCVFLGKKGQYIEIDFKDGNDTYALTKSLGEVIDDNALTLRTSIIGPELKKNGEGLLHWFLNQTGTINGFTNAFWSGVTTLELAKVISIALKQELSGLYHVTNGIPINKYDLLKLFKRIWNSNNIELQKSESKFVDKSFIDTRKELHYQIPSYDKMLLELKEFMSNNKKLYPHYNFI